MKPEGSLRDVQAAVVICAQLYSPLSPAQITVNCLSIANRFGQFPTLLGYELLIL